MNRSLIPVHGRALVALVVALACGAPDGVVSAGPASAVLTVPGFGQVQLYAPSGTPSQVVLFISGDGGWNLGVVPMAEALRDRGALVAGIDIRAFVKSLNTGSDCAYPAGDLERLSQVVQRTRGFAEYKPPILVGYSSGATLVYAALAAAPPETFAGAISLGFCPDLEIGRRVCQQNGLTATRRVKGPGYDLAPNRHLVPPWMVLQGDIDQVCAPAVTEAFVKAVPSATLLSLPKVGHGFAVTRNWEPQFLQAYDTIAARRRTLPPPASAPDIHDLALEEVPVAAGNRASTMAIILTGDGGWAELDKAIAQGLVTHGVPSVGWSSLHYYWKPRTPETAAADLARIMRHYQSAWSVNRFLLVGYSFGADVLPFLVNRLPDSLRAQVQSIALLGLSATADFEFHVADWIRRPVNTNFQTIPEVERLTIPVTCVRGEAEDESACRSLRGPHIRAVTIGSGHHFGGNYTELVNAIASTLK
jgi:type IV secretory pathway VirJ component